MNPRSPCRSVSLFSCISQFVWQPWKDNIQTTGMRHVDAGYDEATECAQELGIKIPML